MSRALIFSDSHGRLDKLLDVLSQHPDADAIFHLGDIASDADRLRRSFPGPVYIVRGNCDYAPELPENLVFDYAGKKVAMSHGHRYLYQGTLDLLKYWGREQRADIVMFGHTHVPCLEQNSNMVLLNPGSISKPRQSTKIPTYTVMEITADGQMHFDMCEYRGTVRR